MAGLPEQAGETLRACLEVYFAVLHHHHALAFTSYIFRALVSTCSRDSNQLSLSSSVLSPFCARSTPFLFSIGAEPRLPSRFSLACISSQRQDRLIQQHVALHGYVSVSRYSLAPFLIREIRRTSRLLLSKIPLTLRLPWPPTEPLYLQASPTTALLSDTRPTSLSPSALSALNATLDELLQLFIHASLIAPTGASPPSVNGTPPLSAGPLGPKDVYTTERFAAGVRRVLGPNLGKNVVLEAELAIRELLRMGAPSLRGDGALRKGSFSGTVGVAATTQADDLFRLLREWVMEISGLGGA